ncbi:MAG: FHA domain-containing protein [Muribaculum sp.]|nr:FHA domain-containing protein [Muribaculum sp.]
MDREYIIGRTSDSPVKVPAEKAGVSVTHAKITIKENGTWEIEDLNSANGTFLKDKNGNFQRVFKKIISENSIIRLGHEGHGSFIFMAHRVIATDPSYEYEFKQLKKQLNSIVEEETTLEHKNQRNMKIVKAASPIALGLCVLAQYGIPGLKEKADLNLWISRIAMGAAPVIIGTFFGIDTQAVKTLKQKRIKLLTCPQCGYPISEFDIQNMQCTRCKAK